MEKINQSIKDLLDIYGLSVIENSYLPYDGIIVNKIIFIKRNLNATYKNFIIMHELGHYVLHQDFSICYSFTDDFSCDKEQEANLFAVLHLLKLTTSTTIHSESNLVEQLLTVGVPQSIAEDFVNKSVVKLS